MDLVGKEMIWKKHNWQSVVGRWFFFGLAYFQGRSVSLRKCTIQPYIMKQQIYIYTYIVSLWCEFFPEQFLMFFLVHLIELKIQTTHISIKGVSVLYRAKPTFLQSTESSAVSCLNIFINDIVSLYIHIYIYLSIFRYFSGFICFSNIVGFAWLSVSCSFLANVLYYTIEDGNQANLEINLKYEASYTLY